MKRLFVAIHLQPSDELLGLLDELRHRLGHERINWVKPENMHLTLKFLGETPEVKLAAISHALRRAVENHRPFAYQFDRTGIFGSRHDPRVLWLGMQERSRQLDSLAGAVLDAMDAIGFLRDRQNFVPHLTLGRIHQLQDKKLFSGIVAAIPQRIYLQGVVEEVVLYESILLRQGPRYVPLERFALAGPAASGPE
ncbi:MAG TPA: RNA 2',3'-cyclic phosphodiesterase [Bacteroidales bacterium]|nr:RNA 2',3'-cyclic phosphodiesterase [Bacteroidales bacterium]